MNVGAEQISTLQLFNEKGKKLARSGFIDSLTDKDNGIKIDYEKTNDDDLIPSVVRKGASDEGLDAFILTYRFFIQNNETILFENIAKIYSNPTIHKLYRDCFHSARNELNALLDSPNELGIQSNNKTVTNREFIDTFIYGDLAHAKPVKRKELKEWRRDKITPNLLQGTLSFLLIDILNIILYVFTLNEGAIKDLSTTFKPTN